MPRLHILIHVMWC
ncbi:hypothetical protein F383_33852 [Gossypium arboreum]|uniref:Uncharacterized protein n=1 Tax=Gossypium arboreum TaxID=29729 RepID=A0A0B0PNU6_GOSAR|nr:hypothetical protein F383_33852 [Gossypium arboreum]